MASLISSAMPVAAEPPPRNRNRCSVSFCLVIRSAAEDPGQRDRGGALDVVVVGADLVPVARQDRHRVDVGEILPLQAAFRKQLLHRLYELVDEGVVLRAAHAVLAQAEIERVFEQRLVVGADVEHDRQGQLRRHAGAGGVERQLAHRDAHAADAEIAEAEDALAIRRRR